MYALVLTFDRYKAFAQHMIMCYAELWPDNPFTFRIPYQSEEQSLFVKFLGNLGRVKILGVSHLAKKLLASAGELHPVGFKALAKPSIGGLFHATKIGKENHIYKFNKLCVNGLKAISGPCDDGGHLLFGGPNRKFSRSPEEPMRGFNRLNYKWLRTQFAI